MMESIPLGGVGNTATAKPAKKLVRALNVWDGIGTVVGIIIGSGIFASAGTALREASGDCRVALVAWAASAGLVAVASLCYCELGASIPSAGGDAEYLRQAYGDGAAFVFVWTNFWILKPGSQAIIATVFGEYLVTAMHPRSAFGSNGDDDGDDGALDDVGDDDDGSLVSSADALAARWLGVGAIVGLTALNCFGVRGAFVP